MTLLGCERQFVGSLAETRTCDVITWPEVALVLSFPISLRNRGILRALKFCSASAYNELYQIIIR